MFCSCWAVAAAAGTGHSDKRGCKKCSHGARAKPKPRPKSPRDGPRPKAGGKKKEEGEGGKEVERRRIRGLMPHADRRAEFGPNSYDILLAPKRRVAWAARSSQHPPEIY
jgi:hypothetical protein